MNRTRRILFVSNLFPDRDQPVRGLDNATLMGHLAGRFEIRALGLRPTLPFRRAQPPIAREADAALRPEFLEVPYIPKLGGLFNHRLMANAIRPAITRIRGEFEPDGILAAWLFPDACAAGRIAAAAGLPFVAIAQGTDVHHYLAMPLRRREILARSRDAKAIITRSGSLATQLADAGVAPGKLFPIHNGIDRELFKPGDRSAARAALGLPGDAPILLFVGNFYPVKNPGLLLSAHRTLRAKFPNLRSILVGDGPLEPALRERADDGVVFAGRKASPEIAEWMRAADALCLPSWNEGLPNVILEAIASGLPSVASAVGGIGEVVDDPGIGALVPPGDEPALVAAVEAVLEHPPDRSRIRARSESFSWGRTAAAYGDLLDRSFGKPH